MTGGAATTGVVRVMVVDDHPLFCEGVAAVLEADAALTLVGRVGTVYDALGELGRLRPDVVLVDLGLPDGSGLDVCRRIRAEHPGARPLVVTRSISHHYVTKAFAAGAVGYLVKTTDPSSVVQAVRIVAGDGTYIDPTVAQCVVDAAIKGRGREHPFRLTRQEAAVLEFVEGTVDLEVIGRRLRMSAATVETHLTHAMRKVGTDDPREAARILRRQASL